ncbi:MAG: T9SS type A sorting domain-containing protein [bacterium]|nr:T9SS type A sorting domain-containing protein [bacterium]
MFRTSLRILTIACLATLLITLGALSALAQPSWIPISGADITNCKQVYEDPISHNIYAACVNAGVWRSTNQGDQWTYVGGVSNSILSVGVNERGYLFAGSMGADLFRSMDDGHSWTQYSTRRVLSVLCIDSLVFASSVNNQTHYSRNWGQTFDTIPDLGRLGTYSFHRHRGDTLFAGTRQNGIYRSTNRGASWQPTQLTTGRILAFSSNGDLIYATSQEDGAFLSTDGGMQWTSLGLLNMEIWGVVSDTLGRVTVATYSFGCYTSLDSGRTWNTANTNLNRTSCLSLIQSQSGNLFVSTEEGIYRSSGYPIVWSRVVNGITSGFVAMTMTADRELFGSNGYGDGLYSYQPGSNSWRRRCPEYKGGRALYIETNGLMLLGDDWNYMHRSTDHGATWNTIHVNGVGYFTGLIKDTTGNYWASAAGGIFCGGTSGTNWMNTTSLVGNILVDDIVITRMGTILGISTFNNSYYILRSSDQGNSWQSSLIYAGGGRFALHPDGSIYLSTYNFSRVYYSTDDGLTWQFRAAPLNSSSIAINHEGAIFLGYSQRQHGIQVSTDQGVTWNPFNEGLPTEVYTDPFGNVRTLFPSCWRLMMDQDDYLYMSCGNQIYRTFAPTSGIEENETLNAFISLIDIGVSPNPFNSTTTLHYSLPQSSDVTISVTDILGRKVKEELLPLQPAGVGKWVFDGGNLATGNYYYRITTTTCTATGKMTLLK